ncbi:MAG: UvrD-helicase domain-containing protein [Candidatus Dormibacteraceae bacterium]
MDIDSLNAPQRAAVTHEKGPLLIFAGAGSGKTRVLTMRIANLAAAGVADPERILALTFTNKAAKEMRARLATLVGEGPARQMWIGTFHAIATRMLRPHAALVGYREGFVIFDEDDSRSLLKRALADLEIDPRKNPLPVFAAGISKAKAEMQGPGDLATRAAPDRLLGLVYERYQALARESNGMDFDDLILNLVSVLKSDASVREEWRGRFDQVLVDEYQDTNQAQYELLMNLAGGHRNLTVVGDDDQSIYAFRGADVRNILGFQRDFPEAKVVKLEQNYRSTQAILDVAHAVIARNPERADKRLWTASGPGSRPVLLLAPDDEAEAAFVAAEIDALRENGLLLDSFAILYRTNAQSRAFERALLERRLPYNLVGGMRFWDRREIKDVVSYLRFLVNPSDAVSFDRICNVPKRRISDRTAQAAISAASDGGVTILEACGVGGGVSVRPEAAVALGQFHADIAALLPEVSTRKPSELIQLLIRRCNLAEHYSDSSAGAARRLDNLEELRDIAHAYDRLPAPKGLQRMLTDIALTSDTDDLEEGRERVTLITLHMAKGLEWPVVFLTGLEDKMLPHSRAFEEKRGLEEERRLCYVGITRARTSLYLTVSNVRTLFGKAVPLAASQFLHDVPGSLLKIVELDNHRSQALTAHLRKSAAAAV